MYGHGRKARPLSGGLACVDTLADGRRFLKSRRLPHKAVDKSSIQ
jgi:hypothetical protein